MNADAKVNPPFGWHAGLVLNEAVLNFNRAAHRIHNTAEFDDAAVACALDVRP